MRILCWNCRSLGKSSTVLQCQKKALQSRPHLLYLMETRLVKDKGQVVWQKCGFSNGWELPRKGFSGGLLLAWRPRQKVQIIYKSKHLVQTEVVDNKGNPLQLLMYMVNLITQKENLFGLNLENLSFNPTQIGFVQVILIKFCLMMTSSFNQGKISWNRCLSTTYF